MNGQLRAASKLGVLLGALAIGMPVAMAKVNVKIDSDKMFDFKSVRTWGWNPSGPGEVKMARTPDDDPEATRKRVEPIIVDAVNTEIGKRGLTTAPQPDLVLTYYLLLTVGAATQTVGQFLP